MSMSKKDYELLAQSLAETQVVCEAEVEGLPNGTVEGIMTAVVTNLCTYLKGDNASFRPNSFKARYYDNVAALREERSRKVEDR